MEKKETKNNELTPIDSFRTWEELSMLERINFAVKHKYDNSKKAELLWRVQTYSSKN